ncbi:ArdC family protein [Aureimonas leprariae]|uniref:DUF1738 domain-containing protein n=1 Tax=Plantimonas leprariae TaxID=2615207 RepID=A0A7V7TYN6_9HYPH|nr:zincin-like metallopeptidase domain-containing protein [Aureimonas leprariae]KAB0677550.1 DUF1738 domain-containing protein [Aureimonas leprariae]
MTCSVYSAVTATILQQLETADPATFVCPWHRPGGAGLPTNALTRQPYRGINILSLWCGARRSAYADDRWATYRQWAALGAQVRRGEKGTSVIFYRDRNPSSDAITPGSSAGNQPGRGQDASAAADADKTNDTARFVARASTVFNIAQVDGFTPNDPAPPPAELDPTPRFDSFVAATGAAVCFDSDHAAYLPSADLIRMPPRQLFLAADGYAATLAHELIHWTGARHRLDRDLSIRFGSRAYAAEELIAELGSAFVLASLQLAATPHPNHAAYMASWLPLLRADPRALVTAAAQASRAADWLTTMATTDASAELVKGDAS